MMETFLQKQWGIFEGVSGRLDISYDGTDVIRVRDNAVVSSEFSLV